MLTIPSCRCCLQEDNNTGTFPLQSERFFNALKGHGAPARVVLLPHEGHGYRARESVLHTLYEQVQSALSGEKMTGCTRKAALL
jgi:hypothetical protein